MESIPPAYVAWQPVKQSYSNSVPNPIDCLKISAQMTMGKNWFINRMVQKIIHWSLGTFLIGFIQNSVFYLPCT
jgi:hypothetical protein